MRGLGLKATLEEGLSSQERDNVLDQVRKIKGVISASFNPAAEPAVIAIHATGNIQETVKKISGIEKIELSPQRRM